ncbi:SAG-related sequence [Besnoitia besnoiti]|uniref:SAG-related sequence n=1 Tax=Besnoitia besnoiti TaxID=94643 RepID=A0A2A9MJN4_BESBE|nr:SAG-related sequence [Besnoitia besnoiti]PFH36176.1 SAG-related sequence [Besnoitia besnoiti]
MQKAGGNSKARGRKLMALCIGGFLLYAGEQARATDVAGLLGRKLSTNTEPVVSSSVATCELETSKMTNGKATPTSISLFEGRLTAVLKCRGAGNAVVPSEDGKVCVAHEKSVNACATAGGEKQEALNVLLGSDTPITAVKRPLTEKSATGQEWTLHLKRSQLPRSDKSFFVGCQTESGNNDSSCMLDVNVKAKASSVQNNVVTCAYGAASNGEEPLTVDMTQENNKLTIDCGDEGSLKPAGFNNFCTSDDKDLETCSKQFVEMFPNFQKSWWQTTDAEGSPATLTIPPSDFPSEEKQFLLACKHQKTSTVPTGRDTEAPTGADAGEHSTCKVLVTVKAASSPTSSTPALSMAAGLSGGALSASFIAGSL